MTVFGLCFLAFACFLAFVCVFVAPWFDIRNDVDWQKIGKDLGDGYSSLRNEVDR